MVKPIKDLELSDLSTPSDALSALKESRKGIIEFSMVKDHTMLIGANELLPEDALWRKDNPKVPAMICMEVDNVCHCPWGCIPKLVMRCVSIFGSMPNLEQIFILFKREENDLVRYGTNPELVKGMDPVSLKKVKKSVPRVRAIWIPRDFGSQPVPYRVMPANYDGLRLSMEQAVKKRAEVPMAFWEGSVGAG